MSDKILDLETLTDDERQSFISYILANDPHASYTFHKVVNGESYSVSGVTLEMVINPEKHKLMVALQDVKHEVWQVIEPKIIWIMKKLRIVC